jgi:predicted enzyme related to lactoylglutathione lyase
MSNQAGRFVWRELLTADTNAALRYYGEVLG